MLLGLMIPALPYPHGWGRDLAYGHPPAKNALGRTPRAGGTRSPFSVKMGRTRQTLRLLQLMFFED